MLKCEKLILTYCTVDEEEKIHLGYSAKLNKVYLVPFEDVGTTRAHLRLEPSKNHQKKNVRWAKNNEL